jgi:hypothetical protein
MRINMRFSMMLAACLVTMTFGGFAYGQKLDTCGSVDGDCSFSETPVPGVRVVQLKDYPKRAAHYVFGDTYTTLATSHETHNKFNVFDFQVPPRGGPIPHTHRNEWEIFFVEQGTPSFVKVNPNPPFETTFLPVQPGTAVFAPDCEIMWWFNTTNSPSRILSMTLPGGLDMFFHNSGREVMNYNAPVPAPTFEDVKNIAHWGDVYGIGAHDEHIPPPFCPDSPHGVISNIADAGRPRETGPFGETRVVLLTPTEVGDQKGATAFCGPGEPGRPGATVKYSYFSLPGQKDFPGSHTAVDTELFYTLGGTLEFLFDNDSRKRIHVDPLSYIEIQPGVTYSIANLSQGGKGEPAQSLAINVISPVCH